MTHIEAMKQALEALEEMEKASDDAFGYVPPKTVEAITSLRTAIASYSQAIATEESSATQEPECEWCDGSGMVDSGGSHPWGEPINIPCRCAYPQPKAEQTSCYCPNCEALSKKLAEQETKREPLTDEQIDEVTQQWAGHSMVSLDRLVMCREYAKAIEAAHGIYAPLKGEA